MRAALALIALFALASPCAADPEPGATPAMTEAARRHFTRGAAHYEAGAYAQAIEAFERGRRLDAHPDFLYSLAQAHRKNGDCVRAIALYQAFLATRPPAQEAARARANLERCPLSTQTAAPVESPPARVESPWYSDVAGGLLLGAGLIGVGIGTTYLVRGDRAIDQGNREPLLADRQAAHDRGTRDRRIGAWSLAGGGALIAGAIVRYALQGRAGRGPARSLAVVPANDAVAVAWGGAF